jgi:hypothetical protein
VVVGKDMLSLDRKRVHRTCSTIRILALEKEGDDIGCGQQVRRIAEILVDAPVPELIPFKGVAVLSNERIHSVMDVLPLATNGETQHMTNAGQHGKQDKQDKGSASVDTGGQRWTTVVGGLPRLS